MTSKTLIKHILVSTTGLLAFTIISLSPVLAFAADGGLQNNIHVASAPAHAAQKFKKKKYKIQGDWRIVQEGGQTLIRFSEDFKTKNGPDLKVFLSPQALSDVTGKTALNGAVKLGKLTSNSGSQDYVLPAGISLSDFSSVLIHCEAFSVLWGGGEL